MYIEISKIGDKRAIAWPTCVFASDSGVLGCPRVWSGDGLGRPGLVYPRTFDGNPEYPDRKCLPYACYSLYQLLYILDYLHVHFNFRTTFW